MANETSAMPPEELINEVSSFLLKFALYGREDGDDATEACAKGMYDIRANLSAVQLIWIIRKGLEKT